MTTTEAVSMLDRNGGCTDPATAHRLARVAAQASQAVLDRTRIGAAA